MDEIAYKEKIKGIDRAIEWHDGELKAWQRVKSEAEVAQVDAEKPKLRHWDLVLDKNQKPHIVIEDMDKVQQVAGPTFLCIVGVDGYSHRKIGKLQDYFDHLTAVAEPLTEFDMKETSSAKAFTGAVTAFTIMIKDEDGHVNVDLSDLSAFILKLQRLQYTERKKHDA